MAKRVFKKETNVHDEFKQEEISVQELMLAFKEVGKYKVAGSTLEQGCSLFPDALALMIRGKRTAGSEPAIIKAYIDVVGKLQKLHGALKESTVSNLTMPAMATAGTDLQIVPYRQFRELIPEPVVGQPVHASVSILSTGCAKIQDLVTHSSLLAWLFGPTMFVLFGLRKIVPPTSWILACVPYVLPCLLLKITCYSAGLVLTRPEFIIDWLLGALQAVPNYFAYAIPRMCERFMGHLAPGLGLNSTILEPPSMTGTEVPITLFSAGIFWLLGRVGR
tara:strand:- start:2387 stop:3217 length:831 start_codon:yes stop_codon:yes gene_type:complete